VVLTSSQYLRDFQRLSEYSDQILRVDELSEGEFSGCRKTAGGSLLRKHHDTQLKGLILAQNERWRRGLGMRVEREPARGTAANGVGMVGNVPFGRG
jgi:hypothetical protein